MDELWSSYRQEVSELDDAMYLQPLQADVDAVLEDAAEAGKEKLADLGITPTDPEIYFIPSVYGATVTDDGPLHVGRFGGTDREYTADVVMAHEHFHHYVFHDQGVEQYRPREEAFAKVLDMYHMGILDDEEAREAVLEEEKELYNEAPGVSDNFGNAVYRRAKSFIAVLEKDMDGPLPERMDQLLDQYIEFHMDPNTEMF